MGAVVEVGLNDIFTTYFATAADFEVGLATDASLAADAVLGDLTEVSGSGYARIALTTITISEYGSNDRKAAGNTVTFAATGDWTTAKIWFIRRISTNKLLCWDSLGEDVTLHNGETRSVIPAIHGTA